MYNNCGNRYFDDPYEMTYNLLNAIGLSIDGNGYVYDQDTRIHLLYQGKKIKASIDPNNPAYAGEGEITMDLIHDMKLANMILLYFIDKESNLGDLSIVSQFIEEVPNGKLTALGIKKTDGSSIITEYYTNKALKYIEAVFLLDGEKIYLHNFDSLEEG